MSGDDDQLKRYLSGEVPTPEELKRTLAHEVRDFVEFPVLLGSAITGVGVDRLADYICEIGPSPVDRPISVRGGEQEVPMPSQREGEPSPTCSNRRRPIRRSGLAVQGDIRAPSRATSIWSTRRRRRRASCTGLPSPRGRTTCTDQPHSSPVIIGGVAKLGQHAGRAQRCPRQAAPVDVPRPVQFGAVAAVALEPSHAIRTTTSCRRALHPPPARGSDASSVDALEETHKTVLRGLRRHAPRRSTLERIQRKFGVNVDTKTSRVALPRDDHRSRRRRRQGEEAERRARSVCGRATSASAPVAHGEGSRVRRRPHRRRSDPALVHPGGREGRRRGDGDGRCLRLSRRRRHGGRLRRQVPLRRLVTRFRSGPAGGQPAYREGIAKASPVIARAGLAVCEITVPTTSRAT